MDWKDQAAALAAAATPPGSRWREPIATTPRHVFVPRWWAKTRDGWDLRVGDADRDRWLAAAYRDWTLVTSIGGLHADHAEPGTRPKGSPTSSSTLPGLVAQMFRHASIGDRCTVLDVGTGSGYGTAVLCARLGDAQVTAIDVDPYLNEAAAERLEEAGYRPRIITADATGPLDWEGDRIAATVAVGPAIPASWLAALKVGGRLVTTITDTSLVLTADKQQDGGAAGMVQFDRAGFMRTRTSADYPPRDWDLLNVALDGEGEHVVRGRYPVLDVVSTWDVSTMLEIIAPGIGHYYDNREDGTRVAIMTHSDGSWARAEERDDKVTVHQGGPRRLWDYLDEVRDYWIRHGDLPFRGAEAIITPEGVITLRRGRWIATIGPG
ncbi:protein-L-isoaspartate(D-aspartate) O-methyltransferase [Spongiactinospora rosea]|uniref:Protein-L-isoaspartate O-methyltransferase n=1 Tax=Spongiactinospora rosea TaxID=2248750 RepID=A0A366M0M9_9ACTN|nr:methyltransferase domain-containing protein [Spongiactinospora rosea]RBQ19124.1 protein-L-isoaspartate(D-aspartate) O-methyltransferase [Spongiactinospora rosea]